MGTNRKWRIVQKPHCETISLPRARHAALNARTKVAAITGRLLGSAVLPASINPSVVSGSGVTTARLLRSAISISGVLLAPGLPTGGASRAAACTTTTGPCGRTFAISKATTVSRADLHPNASTHTGADFGLARDASRPGRRTGTSRVHDDGGEHSRHKDAHQGRVPQEPEASLATPCGVLHRLTR